VRAAIDGNVGEEGMRMNGLGFVLVAAVALLSSSGPAMAQYYDRYDEVVRCESRDYRQVYCDIDTRGGVRIVNQLSDTACVRGRTWNWDRRGVWVSGGCRAEFAVEGRGGYGSGHSSGSGYGESLTIRCESRGYNQIYCNADTSAGVCLINQLSDTTCIEGQTWGADRRGVWVRGGRRGEFALGRGGYGYDGPGLPIDRGGPRHSGGTVICESRDKRYHRCDTRIRGEVRLVRQLSDSHCVYNRSWGYDRGGVWVDRGCRGEFAVY
jgi:hypothetical protein